MGEVDYRYGVNVRQINRFRFTDTSAPVLTCDVLLEPINLSVLQVMELQLNGDWLCPCHNCRSITDVARSDSTNGWEEVLPEARSSDIVNPIVKQQTEAICDDINIC